MESLINFIEKYKGVRRTKLAIMFGLGVFATVQIFLNMTEVSPAVATCYSTLIISAGALGVKYSDDRKNEGDNE